VFLDDKRTSEFYAEHGEYCPGCGRLLERKDLVATTSAPWLGGRDALGDPDLVRSIAGVGGEVFAR
jgi:hypothetical protein